MVYSRCETDLTLNNQTGEYVMSSAELEIEVDFEKLEAMTELDPNVLAAIYEAVDEDNTLTVGVDYRIFGSYRPGSWEDPPEYGEIEVEGMELETDCKQALELESQILEALGEQIQESLDSETEHLVTMTSRQLRDHYRDYDDY